ncbi:unnamed protein product [Heligmosomoides polygyrus]|uniref:FERM domain-containing protein n=1 Tax=Heligmosomoides polygyrus TaxID=6339 RepID=A0A183GEZ3_HELPZ|nr:unnamed protein product [Heligmosomoides polygyrus]
MRSFHVRVNLSISTRRCVVSGAHKVVSFLRFPSTSTHMNFPASLLLRTFYVARSLKISKYTYHIDINMKSQDKLQEAVDVVLQ